MQRSAVIGSKRKNAFYYKMLIVFICCIEVFLIAFSVLIFGNFQNIVYDKITDLNYEITSKTGNNISNMSTMIETFCDAIYYDSNVRRLIYDDGSIPHIELHRALNRITDTIRSYSVIDSVIIYNNTINKFYAANEAYLNDEILETIKSGQGSLAPVVRKLDKEIYYNEKMVLTYFKTESFDSNSNIVIINVNLDWLKEALEKETLNGSKLSLIDSKRNLIMSGDASAEKPDSDYFDEIYKNSSNTKGIHLFKNKDIITMTYEVPGTDWCLVNESNYNEIYSSISYAKRLTIVFTVMFMLIGLGIAMLITRNLYRPVKSIIDTIESTFVDLKKEQNKTDIQYINDAIAYSQNFSKSLDKYLIKEMLMSNGKVNREAFEKSIARNLRFGKDFSVILILTEIDEMTDSGRSKVSAFFEKINCDVIEMTNCKFLLIVDSSEKDELYSQLSELSKYTLYTCISEECTSIDMLCEEYQRLLNYAKYRLIYGDGRLFSKEIIEQNLVNKDFLFPREEAQKVILALEERDLDNAKIRTQKFLNELSNVKISNYYMALVKFYLMLSDKYDVFSEKQGLYLNEILDAKTENDVIDCFDELFEIIIDSMANDSHEKNSFTAEAIRDYIKENFSDYNLSAKSIAAELKMSQAYVGRLFRNNFEYTIAEYINRLRIEKSLELLTNTNKSISVIMKECGYENESTFFKIFKKYCNITPKNYRIRLKSNNK